MKEFLLVFRSDFAAMPQRTPAEAQAATKRWMDWISDLASQNKLVDKGNRLEGSGKVIKNDNVVINGPYTEIKETIGGYTLVRAESYDEAIELARHCPILYIGGSIEVRAISSL
jgi:hypothetical protein